MTGTVKQRSITPGTDFERENSMANEIVKQEPIIRTMEDAEKAARAMSASGFFADSKQASQAVVKILAGQELGFGPFASMTGVNIIQNKPVLAANFMAAAIKRGGKYNYRILSLTDSGCELEFYEDGKPVGKSAFNAEDAKKAGLVDKENWKKYPRNMYFARALSNGQKWYCPDIFNGATVYTPDELGATVNEDGEMVGEVVTHTLEENMNALYPGDEKKPETRPYSPEALKARMAEMAKNYSGKEVTTNDRNILTEALGKIFKDDAERYQFCKWLTGEASTKKIPANFVFSMLKWMEVSRFEDAPDEPAIIEARTAGYEALRSMGQQELPIN